jgi:alpha-ketoglutarate-dependent taurine dioxygenase
VQVATTTHDSRGRVILEGSALKLQPLFEYGHQPHVIVPERGESSLAALCEYLQQESVHLAEALLTHGALLFRGFELHHAADFSRCAESFGARPFGYVGGNSPRTLVAENVFTSTEYPAKEKISLHNEMSYLPGQPPRRLFFFSVQPAQRGGQTSLAHTRDVLQCLPAELLQRFEEKGLRYIRNFLPSLPLGRSWQETYATQVAAEANAQIEAQGCCASWDSRGALRVTSSTRAFAVHPLTGEKVWFNQAEQWHPSVLNEEARTLLENVAGRAGFPHDCEYADGEPIEAEFLQRIRQALERNKLLFDWRQGDVLAIDNFLMMHGREPFSGKRTTLAYLSEI